MDFFLKLINFAHTLQKLKFFGNFNSLFSQIQWENGLSDLWSRKFLKFRKERYKNETRDFWEKAKERKLEVKIDRSL